MNARTVTVHRATPSGSLMRSLVAVAVLTVASLTGVLVATTLRAVAQTGTEPPPELVILARSDEPADALSAGPIGGVLGAPVLLTPSASLHPAAATALVDLDPDMVILAGGEVALSAQVEAEVAALGYATRRAAGADRHETAVLVSSLLAEYSTGRPVLTGTPVTDEMIPGLNAERLQGETPDELLAAVTARLDDLEAENDELRALLAGVSRVEVDGNDTLRFTGMNLQVVNGAGTTDTSNGLGNVIVGYSAQPFAPHDRIGSHYLVIGDLHEWTAFGGIVTGLSNTASGDWASVSGGSQNTASGTRASVTGGSGNTASGLVSSVSGGTTNTASGTRASISGGRGNSATSTWASVSGGFINTAEGPHSSVSGGRENVATGSNSSVLGGDSNQVLGNQACHPLC